MQRSIKRTPLPARHTVHARTSEFEEQEEASLKTFENQQVDASIIIHFSCGLHLKKKKTGDHRSNLLKRILLGEKASTIMESRTLHGEEATTTTESPIPTGQSLTSTGPPQRNLASNAELIKIWIDSCELQRQSILGKEKHDKLDVVQNDDKWSLESELVLEDYAADDVFDAPSNSINDINQQDHISIEEMIMTEEVLNEILEADGMYMQSGGGCFDNLSTSSSATMPKNKYSSELHAKSEDIVCHSVYFTENSQDMPNIFDNHSDSWKHDPAMDGRNTTAILDSSNLVTPRTEIVAALVNSFANFDRNQDSSNVHLDDTSDFQELEPPCIRSNDRPSFTITASKQSYETTAREEDLHIEEEKSIKTMTDTLFLSEDQHAWLSAEEFEYFFEFPLHAFHHIIRGSYE